MTYAWVLTTVCCVIWPLVAMGILFFIDPQTPRDFVRYPLDVMRGLLGLPYAPRPDFNQVTRTDQLLGIMCIIGAMIVTIGLIWNLFG
jgi:hypothetical protein